MAVEDEKDLAGFLDPADFGRAGIYRLGGTGTPVDINGIFDAPHELTDDGDTEIATVQPMFLVASAGLPDGAGDNDTLTLDGVIYRVRVSEPDGTGMTRLRLERQ